MKKSEEIPSRCLGINSYQGVGDEGLAFTCQGKGAPQLHRRCQRHPLNPTRCPAPLTGGPSGPGWPEPWASESQRVAAHPGQGLLCPPPSLTQRPSLGLGPCPHSVGPAWAQPLGFRPSRAPRPAQTAPAPAPPTPAPPGRALTPRSRRDSEEAGWALCCARSRRLPWCSAAAAAELGGDSGGGGWAWAPLEGGGGGGGGDGRGLGAGEGGGSGRAGGRESGAPSRDSRPVSWRRAAPLGRRRRGGRGRRGEEGGELRRRGVRVNRGPQGRREDRHPRQLPPPLPARAMSRAAALGRT